MLEVARKGAAVALIRNTVDEAVASHAELASAYDGETLLFHARFAMADRLGRRNQWRSLSADEAIQAALDWLEDEDWLRGEATGGTGPGSGRRTLRYRIHPAIKSKRKGHDT